MADLKEILLSKSVVVPESFSFFKDIFKHYRGKQVQGIEGDKRPLLEKAEDFYLKPTDAGLLQGDVLTNISPVWVAKDEDGGLTAFTSDPQMAMVLSTECDSEKRDNAQAYIRLCPVFTEEELLDEMEVPAEKWSSVEGNLKANYYSEYFWMPACSAGSQNMIADLSHIFSVALDDIHGGLSEKSVVRVISLSEDAYFLLLIKLAWFFLRPAAPDTARSKLEKWEFKE